MKLYTVVPACDTRTDAFSIKTFITFDKAESFALDQGECGFIKTSEIDIPEADSQVEKSCETCKHLLMENDGECLQNDGVKCCKEKTWRSWQSKDAQSITIDETAELKHTIEALQKEIAEQGGEIVRLRGEAEELDKAMSRQTERIMMSDKLVAKCCDKLQAIKTIVDL